MPSTLVEWVSVATFVLIIGRSIWGLRKADIQKIEQALAAFEASVEKSLNSFGDRIEKLEDWRLDVDKVVNDFSRIAEDVAALRAVKEFTETRRKRQ